MDTFKMVLIVAIPILMIDDFFTHHSLSRSYAQTDAAIKVAKDSQALIDRAAKNSKDWEVISAKWRDVSEKCVRELKILSDAALPPR